MSRFCNANTLVRGPFQTWRRRRFFSLHTDGGFCNISTFANRSFFVPLVDFFFSSFPPNQGVLALSMVSMSGALMAKKEVLEPFLALILRDDLLSWHVSKAPVQRTEEQQKAVSANLLVGIMVLELPQLLLLIVSESVLMLVFKVVLRL